MTLFVLACASAPVAAARLSGRDTGDAPADTGDSTEETGVAPTPGPAGLAWSFASCGPTDGPAWEIYVGLNTDVCNPPDTSSSRMRMILYADIPVAGNRFGFPSDGQAFYRESGTSEEAFLDDGRVEISADGTRIGGTYQIGREGSELEGTFDASICDSQRQCG